MAEAEAIMNVGLGDTRNFTTRHTYILLLLHIRSDRTKCCKLFM